MRGELERGRECYAQRQWADAYESLSRADQAAPLAGNDLELLALAAYLVGRDENYLSTLERAHQAYLDAGEPVRAVRCAFWLGMRLLFRGETGRATGWLARAQRLLERETLECPERGYLLLPVVEQQIDADDCDAAYATAASAAEIGEACGDADLIACARHQQGRIRLQQGQVEQGLALLDEVMVAVTAAELSPLVTGLMYCSVIRACQEVYAFGRAGEWTAALARWCAEQPDMVAFTGVCRVHRAEIMQLHGAWQDALEEAQRARERSQGIDQPAAAAAFYQQAEVHRLRGEFAAAEEAYRSAGHWGFDPQPGLALMRMAQGHHDAAAAAIRRSRERDNPSTAAREAPACLRRDHAGRRRDAKKPGESVASWRRSPRASTPTCSVRWLHRREARSTWPKVTRGLRSLPCVALSTCGGWSRRRTRPHASAS